MDSRFCLTFGTITGVWAWDAWESEAISRETDQPRAIVENEATLHSETEIGARGKEEDSTNRQISKGQQCYSQRLQIANNLFCSSIGPAPCLINSSACAA